MEYANWAVEGPFNGEDDCSPPEPGKQWLAITGPFGDEIAVIVNRTESPTEDQWSNAELIAAAPDLLEALELAVRYVDPRARDGDVMVVEAARAAIARAKGE